MGVDTSVINGVANQTYLSGDGTVGFTVMVNNEGQGTATGVSFSDPLPAGLGTDIVWTIASQSGPTANAFSISGAGPGGQTLVFSPTTLAAATLPPPFKFFFVLLSAELAATRVLPARSSMICA